MAILQVFYYFSYHLQFFLCILGFVVLLPVIESDCYFLILGLLFREQDKGGAHRVHSNKLYSKAKTLSLITADHVIEITKDLNNCLGFLLRRRI